MKFFEPTTMRSPWEKAGMGGKTKKTIAAKHRERSSLVMRALRGIDGGAIAPRSRGPER